jgi:hypothetical protein
LARAAAGSIIQVGFGGLGGHGEQGEEGWSDEFHGKITRLSALDRDRASTATSRRLLNDVNTPAG